jgi:CBS domain-containing protein
MKAREVMTADVISVRPDTSVLDAAKLMLDKKISGVLVMDGGKLVGILTEGDLLRRAEIGTARKRSRWLELLVGSGRLAEDYVQASGRKVNEVMTAEPLTLPHDSELEDVVRTFENNGIRRVPITYGKVVIGMITRADLIRAFVNTATQEAAIPLSDEDIRQRLLADLEKQRWAPIGVIDITVKGGVVTLTGAVLDERQIAAVGVAAENIPGVSKVDNQLVWIEPVSGMVVGTDNQPRA